MKILQHTENKRVLLVKGHEIPASILKYCEDFEVEPDADYKVTIEPAQSDQDEDVPSE